MVIEYSDLKGNELNLLVLIDCHKNNHNIISTRQIVPHPITRCKHAMIGAVRLITPLE